MTDPDAILLGVLEGYADAQKWVGGKFERIKRISNTKVGDVGQEFIYQLCVALDLECDFPRDSSGERTRRSSWDIRIEGKTFELKTATEDVGGGFQFNHIRYHREYDALLCVGVSPNRILFGTWTKAQVATGEAGHLVSMDKGSSATFKLSKRPEQLFPIEDFPNRMIDLLGDLGV